MKRKEKIYAYRGVWYNSDLDEVTNDEVFESCECVKLDDSIDIVSLYHSNFFEDMHVLTASEFIASDQYEVVNI